MEKYTLPPLIIPGSQNYYNIVLARLEKIRAIQKRRKAAENIAAFITITIICLAAGLYIGSRI